MRTNQEIFDTVLFALRKQGRASMATVQGQTTCCYRGDLGTKCAVGHLIPDEAYKASLEGYNVYNPRIAGAADIAADQRDFACTLQAAHDRYLAFHSLHAWEERMQDIAREFGLSYTEPTT